MTIVYKKAEIERGKLREIILKNPDCLQSGLSFIDIELGNVDVGIIDFLAVDKTGKLAIVNFDSEENNGMLICALSQMQWLKKNENLVKRLFFSENVDFTQAAQLIFVGPTFSEKFRSALKQLISLDIKLIGYKYVVQDTKDAIFFEDLFTNKASSKTITGSDSAPVKTQDSLNLKAKSTLEIPQRIESPKEKENPAFEGLSLDEIALTPEEIAEFMNFENSLEEKATEK